MRLCITGGGTGGHLMIAEALLEAAVAAGDEVIFIGSTKGQDRKYFADSQSFQAVYFLETEGVVNKKGLGKLLSLLKVLKAFLHARKILKTHKIEALYSVGGFSSAPASFAALSQKIPLFIHEQNAVAGKLNRLLKPYATSFISAYDETSPIQGYPVKEIFFKSAHIRESLKTIIFLGGSHGARAINELALSVAKELHAKGIHIIHQAGESDYERVRSAYERLNIPVELYSFTKELPALIARADLAVSRAGASTLWELTTNGVPTFFIPYPYAAGDHQYHNASFIVKESMGWCYRESENLSEKLLEVIANPELSSKSKKLLQYSQPDVAKKMIAALKEQLK